jgi:membrane protease YdiL (CAAX protease family)
MRAAVMNMLGFYVVVGVSVLVRAAVSRLPPDACRSIDVGDVLLGVILVATWFATGREPSAVFGISGRVLEPNVLYASAAVTLALAGANMAVHERIKRRHGDWMRKAGVNPGGAFLAVSALPFGQAVLAGLAYTSSGALLEELVFRWLLMGWATRAGGRAIGMAVQAVLFGLVHAVPMAAHRAPGLITSYAFVMPFTCALAFGWLTRSSGSAMYAWLVHWALNYIALVWALLAARREPCAS